MPQLAPDDLIRKVEAMPELVRAYHFMLMGRLSEEKLASLYRGGKIFGSVFMGKGQEALSVSIGMNLRKSDVFAPLIRDAAGRLAFGETVLDAVRTYLGSALGPMRGRDGNVHRGRPKLGYIPMISHLGSNISVVNGCLLARRMKGDSESVGAASIGEGATSTGAFHEAINQAAVEKLPLVLVIADNQFAYSTPKSRQFICKSLVDRAPGYGVRGVEVDGTDLKACMDVMRDAVDRARRGEGPQMIVGNLLRLCGHGEHDDASYISDDIKKLETSRDCLDRASAILQEEKLAGPEVLEEMRETVLKHVEQVVAQVQREPAPDAYREDWCALASKHLSEQHLHLD